MIDWLTLRHPLTPALGAVVYERLHAALGKVVSIKPDGSKAWEKLHVDHEALRSDMPGLFWTVQGNADGLPMLTIGGSPASIEHGLNVFGSSDIRHCAEVIRSFASQCLGAILPPVDAWECRRIDVTHNYDMKDSRAVKEALRNLLATDSVRRKATSDARGGDSVYWAPRSDRESGKAYHKGPQLRHLIRSGKLDDVEHHRQAATLADRLLRLEMKLGSRWFRELEKTGQYWLDLTADYLDQLHTKFFSRYIASPVEVTDMGNLLNILLRTAPTKGRAMAAHRTWLLIQKLGFDQTRDSMPRATFYRHLSYLRDAGLKDADLFAGTGTSNVVPLRRQSLTLSEPVHTWADLERRAA